MKALAVQYSLFPETGADLKERGMERALANVDDDWKHAFACQVEGMIALDKPFTSEDITDIIGVPPSGSPNAIGATMNAVAKRLRLRKVGYVQATRASRHAGMVAQWQHFPF